uniref:Uncharacterized protein n=1 Tax=Anguilla anguilla TaxID=7936 RepID=A0A0E9V383_ANGAN
MQLAATPKKQ